MIPNFVIPTPPAQPIDKSYPSFRNWLLQYTDRIYNYLASWNSALATVLNGGLPTSVRVITTTPFLVGSQGDQFLIVNAASGPIALQLPPAVGSGNTLTAKKVDATGNAAILTGFLTDLIDGAATFPITIQYEAFNLIDYAKGQWAVW